MSTQLSGTSVVELVRAELTLQVNSAQSGFKQCGFQKNKVVIEGSYRSSSQQVPNSTDFVQYGTNLRVYIDFTTCM